MKFAALSKVVDLALGRLRAGGSRPLRRGDFQPIDTLEPRLLLSAAPFLARQLYPLYASPRLIATGDFNNDGLPDVVAPLPSLNVVSVLMNQGNGTFLRAPFIPFTTPRAVATGDFNGDGNVDIAVAGSDLAGTNQVAIYFGNGDGTFAPTPVRYTLATAGLAISAVDLNGDGRLDLVVTTGRRIAVLINQGDGVFANPVYYGAGGNDLINDQPSSVAIADFNHDGLPDIAVSLQGSGSIGILLNNPSAPGTFESPTVYTVDGNPVAMAAGDFNGDGNTDLAVISSGFRVRSINVLLGNGNGTFGPDVSYPGPYFADAVAAADFTGNGKEDLVVGSFDGPLEYFAGNGDGTFAAPVNVPGAFYVEDIQVADFNGDGLPDIVVPGGGIKVFLNSGVSPNAPQGGPITQTIGAGGSRSYSYFTIDGTRTTVSLSGPGTASLDFSYSQTITLPTSPAVQVTGMQLAGIITSGTTLATALTINTNLRSYLAFAATITTDAPIGSINASSTNLTGDLTLADGARRVYLHSATGGAIAIDGGAPTSLVFGTIANESLTSSVPISHLTVVQDAGVTLTAPSLGYLSVGRSLHDSILTLTDPWAAGAMDLGHLGAVGSMTNVVLMSAGNVGTVAAQYMSGDDLYAGIGPLAAGQTLPLASDFIAPATISKVHVNVPILAASFSNSVIAAAHENVLSLGSIQTSNGGTPFGLVAQSIGAISGTDRVHGKRFVLTNLDSPAAVAAALAAKKLNLQDFVIQIV